MSDGGTPADVPTNPPRPPRQSAGGRAAALARNTWRGLTSMRTALVLLFLLALAAIPGALLPQRSLNEGKVNDYIAARPTLGPIMDKLELFDVFGSYWFTAIYVLLFISLVGCILPRCVEYAKALRTQPVAAPRNLGRLPAQLVARHWIITDANGRTEEVRGDGVVGEQPRLEPGEQFVYTSGATLPTAVGTMEGSYDMVGDDGTRFDAPIPPFTLAVPRTLH